MGERDNMPCLVEKRNEVHTKENSKTTAVIEKRNESSIDIMQNGLVGIQKCPVCTLFSARNGHRVQQKMISAGEKQKNCLSSFANHVKQEDTTKKVTEVDRLHLSSYAQHGCDGRRKLYKCPVCGLCFMRNSTIIWHKTIFTENKQEEHHTRMLPGPAISDVYNVKNGSYDTGFNSGTSKKSKATSASEINANNNEDILDVSKEENKCDANKQDSRPKYFEGIKLVNEDDISNGSDASKNDDLLINIRNCKKTRKSKRLSALYTKLNAPSAANNFIANMNQVESHLIDNTGVKNCQKQDDLSLRGEHTELGTRQMQHKCYTCNMTFSRNQDLIQHYLQHIGVHSTINLKTMKQCLNSKNCHDCDVCWKSFPTKSKLQRHGMSHSNARPHTCETCGKSFFERSKMIRHQKVHNKGKQLPDSGEHDKRNVIPIENNSSCNLNVEGSTSGKDMQYVSIVNDKSKEQNTSNKQDYLHSNHMRMINKQIVTPDGKKGTLNAAKKKFQSTQIGKFNKCKKRLNSSIKQANPERKSVCTTCGRTYAEKKNLYRHMKLHTGVRPFKCGTCGKSFFLKYRLSEHQKVHTVGKSYKCNICDLGFNSSGSLTKHKRTHTSLVKCNTVMAQEDGKRVTTETMQTESNHQPKVPVQGKEVAASINAIEKPTGVINNDDPLEMIETRNKCRTDEQLNYLIQGVPSSSGSTKLRRPTTSITNSESKQKGPSQMMCDDICEDEQKDNTILYKCENGDKIFQLSGHPDHGTDKSDVKCDICGKCFLRKSNLSRHRKLHSSVRPYACDVCGKAFSEKYELRRHEETRTRKRHCAQKSKSSAIETVLLTNLIQN